MLPTTFATHRSAHTSHNGNGHRNGHRNGNGYQVELPRSQAPAQDGCFTKVPNVFFDVLMTRMGDAERVVILALLRQTVGYHRLQFETTISGLQELTGLSRPVVIKGIHEGMEHGWIKRSPGSKRSYVYEVCLNDEPAKTTEVDDSIGKESLPYDDSIGKESLPYDDSIGKESLPSTVHDLYRYTPVLNKVLKKEEGEKERESSTFPEKEKLQTAAEAEAEPEPPPLTPPPDEETAAQRVEKYRPTWLACKAELALTMQGLAATEWLRDTKLLDVRDHCFEIGVPNPAALDWLENRLAPILRRTLGSMMRHKVDVQFRSIEGMTT